MDISKKIITDPINKWVFTNAETEVFLVGGYIRDVLKGHISNDRDYVLKDNIKEIAINTAKNFDGTFIELKKNKTYRIVLKSRHFIDFTYLTSNIYEDLSQRDFTINAIAWSPHTGIIEPFDNIKDLKNQRVRIIKAKNLKADPLRILRAYRFSAQLKFTIDTKTRKYLQKFSSGLLKVAPERITEELLKILNNANASEYLKLCLQDNVLNKIIKIQKDKLKENILLIKKFDDFLQMLVKINTVTSNNIKIMRLLNNEISQGLTKAGLIRLSLLLLNFSSINGLEMRYLRLSRRIVNSIENIQKAYTMAVGIITQKKLFNIYKLTENNIFEITLILCMIKPSSKKRFLKRAEDFIKIKKRDLLSGYEIQNMLNTQPGRLIGYIKSAIFEKQFYGIIKNKKEARSWIISNFT